MTEQTRPDASDRRIPNTTPSAEEVTSPTTISTRWATGTLICGILVCAYPASILLFAGLLGIVGGHITLRRIAESPQRYGSRGRTQTGLVLCYIGVALGLFLGFLIAKTKMEVASEILRQPFGSIGRTALLVKGTTLRSVRMSGKPVPHRTGLDVARGILARRKVVTDAAEMAQKDALDPDVKNVRDSWVFTKLALKDKHGQRLDELNEALLQKLHGEIYAEWKTNEYAQRVARWKHEGEVTLYEEVKRTGVKNIPLFGFGFEGRRLVGISRNMKEYEKFLRKQRPMPTTGSLEALQKRTKFFLENTVPGRNLHAFILEAEEARIRGRTFPAKVFNIIRTMPSYLRSNSR